MPTPLVNTRQSNTLYVSMYFHNKPGSNSAIKTCMAFTPVFCQDFKTTFQEMAYVTDDRQIIPSPSLNPSIHPSIQPTPSIPFISHIWPGFPREPLLWNGIYTHHRGFRRPELLWILLHPGGIMTRGAESPHYTCCITLLCITGYLLRSHDHRKNSGDVWQICGLI